MERSKKNSSLVLIAAAILMVGLSGFAGQAQAADISAQKWQVVEIPLATPIAYNNPYTEVEATATFIHTSGATKIVKGFWDGGNNYKIRFTPTLTGNWNYSIINNKSDAALARNNERVIVSEAPQEAKGFVRVDDQYPTKFVFDSGEYYFMLGTTAYEYVTNANSNLAHWKTTVDFYKSKGISKVRFFVYPTDYEYYDSYSVVEQTKIHGMKYPDTQPFVTDNEGWPNRNLLNVSHWQVLDEMVEYMASQGMIADLIMLNDPRYIRSYSTRDYNNPSGEDLRYMRYVISRYAAYPNVIWCIVNEYQLLTDLPYGLPNKNNYDKWNPFWNTIGNLVRAEDPWMQDFGKLRPLSVHGWNQELFPDETGKYANSIHYFQFKFKDAGWPTFSMSEWGWPDEDDNSAPDWSGPTGVIKPLRTWNKPSVNDEAVYVGYKISYAPGQPEWDSKDNRLYTWSTYIAGGYFSIGDAYASDGRAPIDGTLSDRNFGEMGMSSGDYYYGADMKTAYDEIKNLTDFFTTKGIEYWKMSSHNELVHEYNKRPYTNQNRVYTLADELGNEYIVYAAIGSTFTIDLQGGREYGVFQFNPRTGAETQILTVPSSASSQTITPPTGGADWVYRIKANDTFVPADVNNDGKVNIKDIQICIKGIVDPGSFTTPDQLNQLAKCKAVALPEVIVNIKDIQAIIRAILNP